MAQSFAFHSSSIKPLSLTKFTSQRSCFVNNDTSMQLLRHQVSLNERPYSRFAEYDCC